MSHNSWHLCVDEHAEERERAFCRVQSAALEWWLAHRPVGWNRTDHLKAPAVNTLTDREKRLARAVAALVKMEKKR